MNVWSRLRSGSSRPVLEGESAEVPESGSDPPLRPSVRQPEPDDAGTLEGSQELFAIIDESGKGFGFDLDPATAAKPLAIASSALLGIGMLAGVPAGIALGRFEEPKTGGKKLQPTLGGAMFAFRAFAYGTALCGACGIGAMYATAYYYDAWTWEDFGRVMREVVPAKRDTIEKMLSPTLDSVRSGAADGLPGPTEKARDIFAESRIGKYIRRQIEEATSVEDDDSESSTVQRGPSGNYR